MCYLIAKDGYAHGCFALKNDSRKASSRIENGTE